MKLIQRALSAIESHVIKQANDSKILIEAALRSGTVGPGISKLIQREAKSLQAQNLQKYKQAVSSATDPESQDWTALSQLYENMMLDNHLASIIDSRILFAQRSAFKFVNEKEEENKDVSRLFERPWFDDLIKMVLFSRFQGRTLLEIYKLTPEGELSEIEEIPQPYFNTKLGIITKNPGETSGWNYRDGVFANYYIQIGKDNDLGMLEKLAIIVLAKKLGFGSWLDYIEKYGIPPLFITTDREDNTRLTELFEAAQNFKSNHFMVGRGQEKFEVGNTSGAGVAPFDSIINRANEEMSKRVLGGSGITDEKSFVGSAEIQFKLAKDRYESDKLYFKYFFNQHIRPRLIALSPIYKPLENHSFTWDNTESLNQKEIIDAVTKLGNLYEIDTEFLQQVTGIPILGAKYGGSVEVDPEKKEKGGKQPPK